MYNYSTRAFHVQSLTTIMYNAELAVVIVNNFTPTQKLYIKRGLRKITQPFLPKIILLFPDLYDDSASPDD